MTSAQTAIGIDIGGTGIKGAVVDLSTGQLLSDRVKLPTPEGGKPDDIAKVTKQVLEQLEQIENDVPVGIDFPAVVRHGVTMSAANVSKKWIGFEAEKFFEKAIGRDILFVNDADAAGYAEVEYGAAKGHTGLVFLTTLGTGIGTALINDGVLIPNTELGHLEIDGKDAEKRAAYSAKERDNLDWPHWARRLTKYYQTLEKLFSPDLFIVGGGVSKNFSEWGHLVKVETPMVPAKFLNNAGILGAAALAAKKNGPAAAPSTSGGEHGASEPAVEVVTLAASAAPDDAGQATDAPESDAVAAVEPTEPRHAAEPEHADAPAAVEPASAQSDGAEESARPVEEHAQA